MNEVELFSKGYVVIPIEQYNELLSCYNETRGNGQSQLFEIKIDGSTAKNERNSQEKDLKNPKKEIGEIKNGRKVVDHGKIIALYKAGWSVEEIARDIDASVSTVYTHIEELREGKKR